MRGLLISFCAHLIASSALAQDIEVRSGRHSDFTRLVVDLPERMVLKIEQNNDEATITFPDRTLTFDTTPVFRRIDRDRIRDVTQGSGEATLRIKLGCRCNVSSFWHDISLLVLDVREIPDEMLAANFVEQVKPLEKDYDRLAKKPRMILPQNGNSLAASLANSRLRPETPVEISGVDTDKKPEGNDAELDAEIVTEARNRLVLQIGRAASQGLLTPRSSVNPTEAMATVASGKADDQLSGSAPEELTATDTTAHVNLRAQSSIDRDFLANMNEHLGARSASNCPNGDNLDVRNWGSDAPFSQQVGSLRTDLMGEFDRLNQDTAVNLAKLYLYYGFGAEAEMTLGLAEQQSEEIAVLRSMAEIMDDGYASTNSKLSSYLSCEGGAALWSILSYRSLPANVPMELDSALRTFDALPRHLRSQLGPALSRKFLNAGYQDAADKVLRILSRHEETLTPDAQLLAAEIDLTDGDEEKATMSMQEVVETNSEPSAEALLGLIDAALAADRAVSFDQALLAGAYAQQNRGGPLEQDLIRAYLTGLSASGAFDQSYEEYSRLEADLTPETAASVNSGMLHQLSQRADDVTFLRLYLVNHSTEQDSLQPQIANSAARRLLEMGFAQQARSLLSTDTSGAAQSTRQILRAQASLAVGQPRQAETDLSGLQGTDADLLRAQARSDVGDHHAAKVLYSSSGEPEMSLREAWFAEDWDHLVAANDNTLAGIAALATLSSDEPDTTQGPQEKPRAERVLARNRTLIQQSQAARHTIKTVLQMSPSPAAGAP